jgi:hypothetical protein
MKTFLSFFFVAATVWLLLESARPFPVVRPEPETVAFDSCRLSFIEGDDTVQGRWFRFSDSSWDSAITTAPKVSELCLSCK